MAPIDTSFSHQGFLFLKMVSGVVGQLLENLFNIDLEKLVVDQRIAGFLCIGNDLKTFGVYNPQYRRDDDGIITKVI